MSFDFIYFWFWKPVVAYDGIFVDLQVFVQLYLTLGRVLSIVRGIVFYILSEMAQTWNNTSERLYFQMMSIVSFS